jgi:hypothetical protein
MLDEARGRRCGDEGSRAETTYGDAGDETAAVREPLDQDGDRNDVSESQANAADDSIAEVEPPELERREAGEKDAKSIEKSSSERDRAGGPLC